MNPIRKLASKINQRIIRIKKRKKILGWAAEADMSTAPNGAILFFTPEGGLRPHFAAQCVVARTLKELGHPVLFVRCFKTFDWCPVYSAAKLSYPVNRETRENVCFPCASSAISMLESYGLESVSLNALCTPEILSRVDHVIQNCPRDLNDFYFENIPFGKMTLIDIALVTKNYDYSNVDVRLRDFWLRFIRDALLSYLLTEALIQKLSISHLLVFNDYSVLLSTRLAAQKHGVSALAMTQAGNVDRRRYIFFQSDWGSYGNMSLKIWPSWRDLALTKSQVEDVTEDLLRPFRGQTWSSYAMPKGMDTDSLFSKLGLDKKRKLLVVYTSSHDELIASDMRLIALNRARLILKQPFENQITWLHALIKYVMERKDIQLVVRVHPREGINTDKKRADSSYLALLQENFGGVFERTRFVWPDDSVSTYDLAELADVGLISWSSMGMELARLGVPVLSSTMGIGMAPRDDFMAWGETPNEYFRELESLLCRSPSLDTIVHAYRCFHLISLGPSLDFGDIVPEYDFINLPPYKFPSAANALEDVVIKGRNVFDLHLERSKAAQQPESVIEEKLALKRQLRRMIHFLFTGDEKCADYKLIFVPWLGSPEEFMTKYHRKTISFGVRVLLVGDYCSHYLHINAASSKSSPMAIRLGMVASQYHFAVSGMLTPMEGKRLESEDDLAAALDME